MRGREMLASTRRVALVSLAYGLLLAAALVLAHGGDVSRLVHAAPPYTDAAAAPESLTVGPADSGFDGQFYYRLALHPLSDREQESGVSLDLPALRSQRILYPVLAGVAAFGAAPGVVWALLLINVVALGVVGWLGALLSTDHGRSAGWGLLFALYPGFVYTLGFDLTEIVESALVLGGVALLLRGRYLLSGLVLAAATLAKEPAYIVPFGIGLAWAWQWVRDRDGARPPLSALMPAAIPTLVFAGWQLALWARFDTLPLAADADNNVRYPLGGLMSSFDRFSPTAPENLFRDLSLGLIILVAVLAALAWRRSTTVLGVRLAWIASVGILLLASEFVYAGATSFMRAGTESYLLGLLVLLGADLKATAVVVPAALSVAAITVGAEVVKAT